MSALTKLTFTAGDTLTLTVTAPGRRTERMRPSFRAAKVPTATLLKSAPTPGTEVA